MGFWENHDRTRGMRQGNDVGTQYRSSISVDSDTQREAARASPERFQQRLEGAGDGAITAEIIDPDPFHAEDYDQQHLSKTCG